VLDRGELAAAAAAEFTLVMVLAGQQILAAAGEALIVELAVLVDQVLLSYLTQTHIRQHLQRLVRQQ